MDVDADFSATCPSERELTLKMPPGIWRESLYADIWFLTETHEDVCLGDAFHHGFSGEPDRFSEVGERWPVRTEHQTRDSCQ